MKKKYFLECAMGCVILMIIVSNLTIPYFESVSLCRDIKKGRTEEAIKRINTMKDVNCGTAPIFMKSILNTLEYDIELPLIVACSEGNYQIAEILLLNGANPNMCYKGGFTATEAIFSSNSSNELEMVKLLISHGADVTKAESGTTPLFKAARKMVYSKNTERKNYFADCVRCLLMFDETLLDENGVSILDYAVMAEHIPLIKQLIEKERHLINLPTNDGRTVIFEAVKNNSLEIVKLLIENGADKTALDSTGRTAYDHAVENGYDEIAFFLESN